LTQDRARRTSRPIAVEPTPQERDALARGHRSIEEGRHRRAIQAVSAVREGSPVEAEALTIRGLAHAALEEVGPARLSLERAWKLHPNPMAAKVLAAIYLSAYEHERGILMLQNASRLDPNDFQPWYALGEGAYLRLHRYDDAIGAFQEALKRRPEHMESRIGLVTALLESHQPEEAEPILKGLLQARPDDPKVLKLAALLALELGRQQDAGRYVDRSLELDPNQGETLLLHARFLVGRGRAREGLSEAQRACTLDPNDLAALNLLASIQMTLGMRDQASKTLERRRVVERQTGEMQALMRAIEEKPTDPDPRWRLGEMAATVGLQPLAIQSFQAALVLNPRCERARKGLAALGVVRDRP
jgi:tetratricopeptide (TPR) repeat protein